MAILAGSMLSALSALGGTWLANRYLEPGEVTQFLLVWALVFALFNIVTGVQTEATRGVGNVQIHGAAPKSRALFAPLVLGVLISVAILTTYSYWGPSTEIPTWLLAIGVGLYVLHFGMVGVLAGRERWYAFAILNGGEATIRLASLIVAGIAIGTLFSLELTILFPVALWWLILGVVARDGRQALRSFTEVSFSRSMRNSLFAMGSSAAGAVLINGFPLILAASEQAPRESHTYVAMGALILAVSICRSPIMIPLQAFTGVAISAFLKQRHQPLRALGKPALLITVIGAVGGIAAAIIGPSLFLLIYPPKPGAELAYADIAQGWVLGLLTFGSVFMALLTLSGAAVLALDSHRVFLLGWVVAALVTVAILFIVPLPLTPRVLFALYIGPMFGCIAHLLGLLRVAPHFSETASGSTLTPADHDIKPQAT
ncbi:hypothetical protein [Dermabacter jinjuensis]|uniref:hypothetical protein n=1 Tax=Dermabacter jinjuensis TaxID=1667168 RepID=UPI001876801E|nr:hypothetical protein [Dermabacter jinjuensis]UEB89973.1 hypothetical protein LK448_00220 [Dermabacter jinjuensis]